MDGVVGEKYLWSGVNRKLLAVLETPPGLQGGSKLPHSKVLRTVWALRHEECRRCLRARFARLGVR